MLAAVVRTLNHVAHDRAAWDRLAAGYAGLGLRSWAVAGPCWVRLIATRHDRMSPPGETCPWLLR